MTEQEAAKEYRVTVRGQLETTTVMLARNEAAARRRFEDTKWFEVYNNLKGEEGTVCEAPNPT